MYCEPSWKNASSVTVMIRLVGSTISIPATRLGSSAAVSGWLDMPDFERAGAVDVVGLRPRTLWVEAGRVARSGDVERRFGVDLRLGRLHILLRLVTLDGFRRALLGLLLLLDLLGLLFSLLFGLLLLHRPAAAVAAAAAARPPVAAALAAPAAVEPGRRLAAASSSSSSPQPTSARPAAPTPARELARRRARRDRRRRLIRVQ